MAETATLDASAPRRGLATATKPRRRRSIPAKVYSLVLLVFLIALWEGSVRLFHVPSWLIPSVSDIAVALWNGFAVSPLARDGFWLHSFVTILETVLGYFVGCGLGLALGVAISQTDKLEAVLRPYVVAFQSLPKVAVAPIIVLWLGFGLASKVAIIALLTFFPVLITCLAGFKAVEPERIDLLRSLSASRWHIFTKVKFWTALPFIFAGLEMAAAFAVVGAIVGEFIGAQSGLGVLILQLDSAMDVGGSFAVFIILSLIGVGLSAIIRAVETRVLYWLPKDQGRRSISL